MEESEMETSSPTFLLVYEEIEWNNNEVCIGVSLPHYSHLQWLCLQCYCKQVYNYCKRLKVD